MEASGGSGGAFLKDVVAYVEVWSSKGTENYSKTFTKQLEDMGAKVSKTLNKQVTHVIFKDGYQSTWDKAQKTGAKLVSVLWVEKSIMAVVSPRQGMRNQSRAGSSEGACADSAQLRSSRSSRPVRAKMSFSGNGPIHICRMAGARVDESLFPAVNTDEHLPNLIRKKHKCMQPKDFIPKTPENDKRLQKKFEKMAEELQRQKAALGLLCVALAVLGLTVDQAGLELRNPPASASQSAGITDDAVPVLVFESPCSLVYSSPVNMMKRRLQEMKEKRENLSPTSSQMLEQSQQNPCVSLFETSFNSSHQPLSSDESFDSVSHLSFESPCGDQERKLGRSANDMAGMTCLSSPVLKASSFYGSASPNPLRQPSPQKAPDSPSKESISLQKDGLGAVADSERKQAAGASQGMPDEKHCLSPKESIIEGHVVHLAPKSSSTKRKGALHLGSPPEVKLKRRCKRKSALAVQLFKSGPSLQSTARLTPGTPDVEASLYEDYFSPDNLKERNSERSSPKAQPPASPSLFHCRGLSKWERKNMLEMCDFTCIGKKQRSTNISDLISKSAYSLEKPDKEDVNSASTCLPLVETSANNSPRHPRQPGPQLREDTGPEGSSQADTLYSPAHLITALRGSGKEPRDPSDEESSPREGTTPPAAASPEEEAHSCNLSVGEDCNVQKPAEEKESVATGCTESVKNGPRGPDPSDSSCTDFVRPQEKPKNCKKEEKPTRTLVMTSMPSEKQDLIMQVVSTLKGFSFAPEVCETTTHVLVGKSVRTLNVLMGIARGCWILSYEWVLLSLELGHWISEEPFELSETFPAAPICRLERHLSAQQYQGTLFANQPKMFIAPASSPPRAKLCELVLLCGGKVSPAPQLASLIIGPYKGKKEARIQYLSEKWVLDSITQHKVCDFNNYQLTQ
ncbi:Microcephalin [Apodemus speciosus]|uniref:Microcephalin n=1 Tax=Apodemus speciosus TaxID=105296 RepID=A0ABQ0F156_APOSI